MLILGIETSCDDTGISLLEVPKKEGLPAKKGGVSFNILSNIVSSQVRVHKKYGGVVPNLAAREHLRNMEPCLKRALKEANVSISKVDLIAVTIGPGLIPSLLVGVNFAKALAYKWKKPIVGINHIEAHIIVALAAKNNKSQASKNKQIQNLKFKIQNLFPAIGLVVSGGHTQLVLMKKFGDYKIIGETRDDAAGECFDKVAKLLGLGYPGGPIVAKMATKTKNKKLKIKNIKLPRPMIKHKNYDFSFSGLKTAVLYLTKDMKNVGRRTSYICGEVQQAIIDVLISKTLRAVKEYKAKTIILSGGVAANKELRKQMGKKIKEETPNSLFMIPDFKLCTDNGAMIAMAGYFEAKRNPDFGRDNSWQKIKADANLRLS